MDVGYIHINFSKENIKYKVHMLKSYDLNRFNFIFVSVFTENPLPSPMKMTHWAKINKYWGNQQLINKKRESTLKLSKLYDVYNSLKCQ